MLRSTSLTLALALFLLACGEADKPAPAPAPAPLDPKSVVAGETPEATFAAMRRATLTQDWDALYELNAPSERAKSEARWDEQKVDPAKEEMIAEAASKLGLSLEDLRALPLRDFFKLRNVKQAEANLERVMQFAHQAEFVGVTEEKDDGVVMTQFRFGEKDSDMPMKREGGRYYLWMMLTAMSSF